MKQILMQTRKIAPAAKRELVRESNPPNELQRITLRLPPKKEVISHLVNTMIIARKVPCQSPIQRVAMGLWQGAVEHAVNVAGQMVHLLWNKTKKEKLAKSNTFDTYSGKTSRSFMMPWLWLRVRTNISGKPSGDSCRDGSSLLTCSAQIWVCCVQYGQGKWQNSSWFWQLPKLTLASPSTLRCPQQQRPWHKTSQAPNVPFLFFMHIWASFELGAVYKPLLCEFADSGNVETISEMRYVQTMTSCHGKQSNLSPTKEQLNRNSLAHGAIHASINATMDLGMSLCRTQSSWYPCRKPSKQFSAADFNLLNTGVSCHNR